MIPELWLILLLFLGSLLVFAFLGIPVGFAIGITSILVMLSPFGPSLDTLSLATSLFRGMNSFVFLAFPFYLLLGRIMNGIGMTNVIFDFANAIIGHIHGGLAYVNVVASIIFAGMSGLAVADVAGLGRIEYKAMTDYGYEREFSLGLTGSSSIIGPIMPPSVQMIVFAVLAGQSIGEMFLAGVVPAIIVGGCLCGYVFYKTYGDERYKTGTHFDAGDVWETGVAAIPAIAIPVFIVSGILSGMFTATEAGAISVIYALALGMFYYDELTFSDIYQEARDAMVETFALTFILANAAIYGFVALQLRLPVIISEAILGFTSNQMLILLLMAFAFILIGTFMEKISAISLLVPILIPAIQPLGIDPVHFGVVMVVTLMLGAITPPVGASIYALERVTDASLEEVLRGVLPFYVPILIACLIVTLFPDLSLALPRFLLN